MLKDLNKLAKDAQTKYIDANILDEIALSDEFKKKYEKYSRSKRQSIIFNDNTAQLMTAESRIIFIPNQWFYAAAFMVPFLVELVNYRTVAHIILEESFDVRPNEFFPTRKNLKDSTTLENFTNTADEYFLSLGLDEGDAKRSAQYLTNFVHDYGWWYGSKTIDRNDFFVSPVLGLLSLVNVSQGYVAEICKAYVEESSLLDESEKLIGVAIETSVPIAKKIVPNELHQGINLIVYGAPGTGKSRYVDDNFALAKSHKRTVFHPEYSYYDFVGSYKPVPVYKETAEVLINNEGGIFDKGQPLIDYQFVPGPFIDVLTEAMINESEMHTLIIEEINRADAAAVFGDVFQLLDRDNNGNSEYEIKPSRELHAYLLSLKIPETKYNGTIRIPSNMNIVATMNSADQGVKPLDTAFKRRWDKHYIRIDIDGAVHAKSIIMYAGKSVYWGDLVTAINNKLIGNPFKSSEDKLIGPYFIKPSEIYKSLDKLLLYLWDDVLRYKRDKFFKDGIRYFSDLIDGFHTEDIFNFYEDENLSDILDRHDNSIRKEAELEDLDEDKLQVADESVNE